ncbi:hypothetical protein ABTK43_19790, partial [Acinetobacter baumannii]
LARLLADHNASHGIPSLSKPLSAAHTAYFDFDAAAAFVASGPFFSFAAGAGFDIGIVSSATFAVGRAPTLIALSFQAP